MKYASGLIKTLGNQRAPHDNLRQRRWWQSNANKFPICRSRSYQDNTHLVSNRRLTKCSATLADWSRPSDRTRPNNFTVLITKSQDTSERQKTAGHKGWLKKENVDKRHMSSKTNLSMELLDHTFIRYPNNMTLWPKYENSFGSQSNFYIPLPSRFLGVVQNTKPHLFPRSLEDVSSSLRLLAGHKAEQTMMTLTLTYANGLPQCLTLWLVCPSVCHAVSSSVWSQKK